VWDKSASVTFKKTEKTEQPEPREEISFKKSEKVGNLEAEAVNNDEAWPDADDYLDPVEAGKKQKELLDQYFSLDFEDVLGECRFIIFLHSF
jgi:hypothetical protein